MSWPVEPAPLSLVDALQKGAGKKLVARYSESRFARLPVSGYWIKNISTLRY